jgi:hypothetical protein
MFAFPEFLLPFDDECRFIWYTLDMNAKKEAYSMENKPNKIPCSIGLLAHV